MRVAQPGKKDYESAAMLEDIGRSMAVAPAEKNRRSQSNSCWKFSELQRKIDEKKTPSVPTIMRHLPYP